MPLRFVLLFALGFLVGLRLGEETGTVIWVGLAGAIASVLLFRSSWVKAILCGLCLGGAVFALSSRTLGVVDTSVRQNFTGTVFRLSGEISYLGEIKGDPLHSDIVLGRINVPVGRRVTLACQPQPTVNESRARATHRLYDCRESEILFTTKRPITLRGKLAAFRDQTTRWLRNSLRTDASALAVGLLFGDSGYFSRRFSEAMRVTGTTHITALSGFNVTVILSLLMAVMKARVGRLWSLTLAAVFLVGFTVVTGAAPSLVRAGIMVLIFHASALLGRPIQPLRPLLYTAVVMLCFNPFLAWHDLGFQLSVASTLGLIILTEHIAQFLSRAPSMLSIRESIVTTMAATITTLPIILVTFGRVSPYGVFLNALVLPFIPLAMGLTAIHTLVVSLVPFALPMTRPVTEVLLIWITRTIEWVADRPGAAIILPSHLAQVLGFAVAVGTVCLIKYAPKTTRR